MKDRIKQYMDYKSISAGELSSRVDVQRSNISHILNGRNKPGASFIEKLLIAFPDLNARWLFTGEGEMTDSVNTEVKHTFVAPPEKIKARKEPVVDVQKQGFKDTVVNIDSKSIDKVVILYTDGTFADFKKK
jgi:transcriptional regulator with XRE-family HTH domain